MCFDGLSRHRVVWSLCVFLMAGSAWAQDAGKQGHAVTEAAEGFGWSVALEGTTALVGEPFGSIEPGAVAVLERTEAGEWRVQTYLSASDAVPGDGFGAALALQGDLAFIGAPDRDGRRGAVYVFERDPTTGQWTEAARLRDRR